MSKAPAIDWTNQSVKALAKGGDPIEVIEKAARALVLRARETGWEGPPFNPLRIAEMLNVSIEANSNIADARLVSTESGAKIEFNPQKPRERVRFSIAHELAHMLFPDWYEQIRNRGGSQGTTDDWQLELLCNLAASEFILPIGSLSPILAIPPIEELMRQRRSYDVSAEAFLIRLAKVAIEPVGVFFASSHTSQDAERRYTIDYSVLSPTAPLVRLTRMSIPTSSIVYACTAIGYTDRAVESWVMGSQTQVECVGISAYPGTIYPRVAGLVRFNRAQEGRTPIKILHGSILEPRNGGQCPSSGFLGQRAASFKGGSGSSGW